MIVDRSTDMLFHFRERQRAHLALPGVPILFAILEVVVALSRPAVLALHIVQWLVVALFIIVALMVRELSIGVNTDFLIFGFGPIRRRVRLSDISEVKIVDTATLKAGLGVRAIGEGLVAWVAAAGPAIEVKTSTPTNGPTGFVISTSRPNDLAAALKSGSTSRTLDAG